VFEIEPLDVTAEADVAFALRHALLYMSLGLPLRGR
jgi:hypothetical protein